MEVDGPTEVDGSADVDGLAEIDGSAEVGREIEIGVLTQAVESSAKHAARAASETKR
jgi:hypothetical protein